MADPRSIANSISSDLDRILPSEITDAAVLDPAGTEWVIPLPQVKQAIHLASEHLVAVLGVESFRILTNELGVIGYSGYAFDVQGDWLAFVRLNNEAALRFVEKNPLEKGYGYVLTTASEREFKELKVAE